MEIDKLWEDYSSFTSLNEGHYDYLIDETDFKECMLQFTKHHVTKALAEAAANVTQQTIVNGYGDINKSNKIIVNKDSILNSYNLNLIK